MRITTSLGAAVLAAGMLAGAAVPASANMKRFEDPVGDTKAHNDIRWVEVDNGGNYVSPNSGGGDRLIVRVRMSDVRSGDELRIFVDTRSNNPGPEWRMSAWADSEWILQRVDTWDSPGSATSCPGRVRLTESRDVARW